MISARSRRQELERLVAERLAAVSDGYLAHPDECEALDFKEEAGRRTRTGELEPGERENPVAASRLADEVACFANSPGGGVIVLGVDDKTAEVLGTELDAEWLRHRIYRAVDVAPDVVEHTVAGQRLLALYVPEAHEPVENTSGAIRWRIADHCEAVDRAAWWSHRRRRQGADPMAEPSDLTWEAVPRSAVDRVRGLVKADRTESDRDLLHRIGAIDTEGTLSRAAEVLFASPGRTLLDLTILDVEGGAVLNRIAPDPQLPLLEQVDVVERACSVVNGHVVVSESFAHEQVRRVPASAVREAILNGIAHRDWDTHRSTEVRWVEADSTLTVRSPGGFVGGVTEDNVLTHRHPRHPALADLFRVLDLVDKQGVGVDRMYTAMITLGHRPPRVVETAGPYVVTELVGGMPHLRTMGVFRRIRPEARQKDVRIVILLDALLRRPFLTDQAAAEVLQTDALSARSAFDAARQTTIGGEPMIRRFKDVWVLGSAAFAEAVGSRDLDRAIPVMSYAGAGGVGEVIEAWLEAHDSVTSGDVVELTGASRPTVQRALADLAGRTLLREGAGRSTRFVRLSR